MKRQTSSKHVNLVVPSLLFGGNPQGLLQWMGLRAQAVEGRPGVWRVSTQENYLNRARPGLLSYRRLAGPGVADLISQVLDLPARGTTVEADEEAIQRVNDLGDRIEDSSDITDMFTHIKLATMVAPEAQVAEVLSTGFEALRSVPLAEDPDQRPFEGASVHLAQREPAMTHRIKFPSVWLRFDYDARLAEGEIPRLGHDVDADPGFAAAFDLHSGMLMMEVYFGPLAGCLSPYVWCLLVPRNHGVLAIDLGTTIRGTRSEIAELLQTLPNYGTDRTARRPAFERVAYGAAFVWWTERLDALFGVLTDPAVFADRDGNYRAAAHLHALLTIEQLFQRIVSIQSAARDTHASRVLVFSVLDTLQRLTGRPIETHCSAQFAAKAVDRLAETIPPSARDLLL